MIIATNRFREKLRFQTDFPSTEKQNAEVFFKNSFGLKSVFQKPPFSRRFSVEGRPNSTNEAAFCIFSGVV